MILETKRRVGYENNYYLIVPDHAAGRRNRYTTYLIPSKPSGKVKIIGRELTFSHSRRLCKQRSEA